MTINYLENPRSKKLLLFLKLTKSSSNLVVFLIKFYFLNVTILYPHINITKFSSSNPFTRKKGVFFFFGKLSKLSFFFKTNKTFWFLHCQSDSQSFNRQSAIFQD